MHRSAFYEPKSRRRETLERPTLTNQRALRQPDDASVSSAKRGNGHVPARQPQTSPRQSVAFLERHRSAAAFHATSKTNKGLR